MGPNIFVQLYSYQICRSCAYIHAVGICHRDIKPQNLLVDGRSHALKLCDFGSAKRLVKGEPNVAYICSRYYRAPELVCGATDYTTAIDIWSAACVTAEMLRGIPLFPGGCNVDMLVEIVKVLGSPSREQLKAMKLNVTGYRFPAIRPQYLSKVLLPCTNRDAIDFVSSILRYEPMSRPRGLEAITHKFFDELREDPTKTPVNLLFPDLFNFTEEELRCMQDLPPDVAARLVPQWLR